MLYSSGPVNIITTCSKNPHKLETEEDRSRLLAFFGQIRDRLIILLADKHERLVPDIMDWQLTEADINKDIKVSDLFHLSAIKVQVRVHTPSFQYLHKIDGQAHRLQAGREKTPYC